METKADLLTRFPGLTIETNRNGSTRYRVRIEGQKTKRISLDIGPEHPMFVEAYYCARVGEKVSYAGDFVSVVAATGDLDTLIANLLKGARRRAEMDNVQFDLERQDILQMLDRQSGKCAISGLPFDLSAAETRRRPFAPSLDRIKQGGSYILPNVRLACVAANIARSDWSDDALRALARGILAQGVPQPSKVSRSKS